MRSSYPRYLGHTPEQILGRQFFDLEISYRPVDLKYRIQQAVANKGLSVVENAEYWVTKDKRIYLRIEIVPIVSGVVILLADVTEQYELSKGLQIINESLETANKRLISINEELESANTQLQSVNEEMESVNEELKATNEELNSRIADLNVLKHHHEMVLNSIDPSIIVTDSDLLVKTWNAAAADMLGCEEDEIVGRSLMNLDIGIPLERMADQFRDVIRTGKPADDTLEYIDCWGKRTMVDVSMNPLMEEKSEGLPLIEAKGLVLILKKSTGEAMVCFTPRDSGWCS